MLKGIAALALAALLILLVGSGPKGGRPRGGRRNDDLHGVGGPA